MVFIYLKIDSIQLSNEHRPNFDSIKRKPLGLTSEVEEFPSFSPDGSEIIYGSYNKNIVSANHDIWIKNLKNGKKRQLPISEISGKKRTVKGPDWSPDGERIVFYSDNFGILVMDKDGTNPKQISDFGFRPKWSPDGKYITFSTVDPSNIGFENDIFLYDFEKDLIRKISPLNDLSYSSPDWSPDGKWIICVGGKGSFWEMWLIEISPNKPCQLGDHKSWISSPLWSKSGDSIYFVSNKSGSSSIWHINIDPKSKKLVNNPFQLNAGQNVSSIDISPRGNKIVYIEEGHSSDLWCSQLNKNIVGNNQDTEFLLKGLRSIENIDISPDGSQLVIEASPGGHRSLLLYNQIEKKEKILFQQQPAFAPSWSADGEWIAFDAGGGNNADIWRIPAAGGQAEKIISSQMADWFPTYSHKGEKICFISNRTGQHDIWIKDLTAGNVTQLTKTSDLESRGAWSFGGTKIAYLKSSGKGNNAIWIYDLKNMKEKKIIDLKFPFIMNSILKWRRDDKALFFGRKKLYEIELDDPEIKAVFDKSDQAINVSSSFAIFGDKLFSLNIDLISDIWLLEGLK